MCRKVKRLIFQDIRLFVSACLSRPSFSGCQFLSSALPTCACLCVAFLVSSSIFSSVSAGARSFPPNYCFLSIRLEKDTSAAVLPSKGAAQKLLSLIFSFTVKHAGSYHLCADLKWTLRTLFLQAAMIYRPEMTDKAVCSVGLLV